MPDTRPRRPAACSGHGCSVPLKAKGQTSAFAHGRARRALCSIRAQCRQAKPGMRRSRRCGERSARPSASQKGIRKTPDVAPLPNPAVYENQGGAATRRRRPGGSAGALALEGPLGARRAAAAVPIRFSTAHLSHERSCVLNRPSLSYGTDYAETVEYCVDLVANLLARAKAREALTKAEHPQQRRHPQRDCTRLVP